MRRKVIPKYILKIKRYKKGIAWNTFHKTILIVLIISMLLYSFLLFQSMVVMLLLIFNNFKHILM